MPYIEGMDASELRRIRQLLGLSQAALAELLRLGKQGSRTVRRWELAEIEVPGPVALAVELLLEKAEGNESSKRSECALVEPPAAR